MSRQIKYAQAILEATRQSMENDPNVYIIGLGVPDPKGVFGTTVGLKEIFGDDRVMDMPVSENALTGIAIGSAITGMRPIMSHQRIDFVLMAMDQIINNAAKWHYMFGGIMSVPLVIRLLIGRGWGQGAQHSQSLQSVFAHIPGLKVVMPATPYDAKGLLISSVKDNNPVIFIEHRWLHNITGIVPEETYSVPIGKARIAREGKDITIISSSYMTLEALRAAEILEKYDIKAEVIDLRTIKPIDEETILNSVKKTGRVISVDEAWKTLGLSSEILAIVTENAFNYLKCAPKRVTLPDCSTPTSRALTAHYYPRAINIINTARTMFDLADISEAKAGINQDTPLDVPDKAFTGPF